MKKLISALFVLFSASIIFAENYTKRDLVWTEDFNGDKLDLNTWNIETHESGWVNQELQSYVNSPDNIYVKDGCLVLQALKNVDEEGNVSYTSGRVNTQHKVFYKYGRAEAKIKLPVGKGFLPAFWMMPESMDTYGIWPSCGEIDIVELVGQEANKSYGTIHWGSPHRLNLNSYVLEEGTFGDDFHIFACEWEPSEIRLYVDGNLIGTVNEWFSKKMGYDEVTYPAPYDVPFYFIFNIAVGGEWPGNPDETTLFDEHAQMKVDWVKFYQKKSYNENVVRPERKRIAIKTDESGNLVDSSAWTFMAVSGGEGKLENLGNTLNVSMTKEGSLEYSVQLCQWNMAMENGKVYKYSFDAWADENRTIITNISQPDHNYVRILPDTKENLTKEKKHFEYIINMVELDDPHGRIDFNLGGQGSVAAVHIENVRLEQIGDVDYVAITPPSLPDGNFIHNGSFSEGEGRLGSWNVTVPKKVKYGVTNKNLVREFYVKCPARCKAEDVILEQNIVRLVSNTEVVLEFDARVNKKCRIFINIPGFEREIQLLPDQEHYKFRFVVPETETYSTVSFKLGNGGAKIILDNISIKEVEQ